ncbi:hypothetical protein [Blastococcus sp. PRF04-17]|uniref:hypothetical protein n=1 Tax=Blastococcus sp. PRF04-17 TaxID=2933797 RepID=UPI001FF26F27|nr:hypothetical protein [Blastococcus sp. PRF04-17]UOY03762.1 hypothetical protein MVA48_10705 [Blastococcus sp. PRF04-17]
MTTVYSASAVLPYQHRQGAAAGLRAELRYLVELGYLLGRQAPEECPDWTTLVVTGPTPTTDAQGREWFEYSATVTSHRADRPA